MILRARSPNAKNNKKALSPFDIASKPNLLESNMDSLSVDPVALFSTGSGGEQRGAEVVGGIPVQREANNIVPMPFF